MSTAGGVLHFKAAHLPPTPPPYQPPKWADPPFSFLPLEGHIDNLISNSAIVCLLTTHGCGGEGCVYGGVDTCRRTVTCLWLGWNLSPTHQQLNCRGLLGLQKGPGGRGPPRDSLTVRKNHSWHFTTMAGISQRMCNRQGVTGKAGRVSL